MASRCGRRFSGSKWPSRVGVATAWLRLASMIGPTVVGLMIGGLENVFLAFGVIAALAAIVTAVFAVETKNRVLEEVSP